ncbi:putative Signaling mucin MSB2 [Glarea lozoyensis 74030]|uniref:Putative Signaling mucin MSB2 n=1 Tax=Glarea lozoyensis (strain ATCC 74030 / MF5533) TaxID=1104152 RepID=H0ERY6_GLAL7|nr:putative Signaling mucin MSB2 [Glarea lozoyensis 74030]
MDRSPQLVLLIPIDHWLWNISQRYHSSNNDRFRIYRYCNHKRYPSNCYRDYAYRCFSNFGSSNYNSCAQLKCTYRCSSYKRRSNRKRQCDVDVATNHLDRSTIVYQHLRPIICTTNHRYQSNSPETTPLSSAQIFKYLPQGIADGLGLDIDQVTIQSLAPLDTTAQLGFITTLAMAYIPTSLVESLSLDLHIPTSAIYKNDDNSVQTLVNYINPAIPITPGSNLDGSGSSSGPGASPSSPGGGSSNNDGAFNTDNQNQSSSVKGTTAGIAMAAIGGSAAYGAAMFLIARRYKKRKQSHRRSSSLMGPEMRSGSPALMGGANAFMSGGRVSPGGTITNDRNSRGSGRTGNSARTQQISAPMMAENSLGWN